MSERTPAAPVAIQPSVRQDQLCFWFAFIFFCLLYQSIYNIDRLRCGETSEAAQKSGCRKGKFLKGLQVRRGPVSGEGVWPAGRLLCFLCCKDLNKVLEKGGCPAHILLLTHWMAKHQQPQFYQEREREGREVNTPGHAHFKLVNDPWVRCRLQDHACKLSSTFRGTASFFPSLPLCFWATSWARSKTLSFPLGLIFFSAANKETKTLCS